MSGVTLLYFHKLDDHNLISTVLLKGALYLIPPMYTHPICPLMFHVGDIYTETEQGKHMYPVHWIHKALT